MCSYTIEKQRCRDRVINDFLSRSRNPLVPLLFHEVTSLHPPSFQRNDFSTCSTFFFYLGQSPNKNGNVDRQMTSSMHFGGCFGEFC